MDHPSSRFTLSSSIIIIIITTTTTNQDRYTYHLASRTWSTGLRKIIIHAEGKWIIVKIENTSDDAILFS
jgi:hypothetical protein